MSNYGSKYDYKKVIGIVTDVQEIASGTSSKGEWTIYKITLDDGLTYKSFDNMSIGEQDEFSYYDKPNTYKGKTTIERWLSKKPGQKKSVVQQQDRTDEVLHAIDELKARIDVLIITVQKETFPKDEKGEPIF